MRAFAPVFLQDLQMSYESEFFGNLRQTRKGVESTKLMLVQVHQYLLYEDGQKQYLLLQFYKTIIGYLTRNRCFRCLGGLSHILNIIMFETAETARMEQNEE